MSDLQNMSELCSVVFMFNFKEIDYDKCYW